MNADSAETLDKLWRNGVYLKNAWLTYSHPDAKAEWKALQSQSAIDALHQGAQEASASDASPIEKLSSAFSKPQSILAARSALKAKMQQAVLGYIRDGHLFAYGFEPPRRMNDQPVPIPPHYWPGKPDWENSAITFQGIQLVEVKLTTQRIRAKILNLEPVSEIGAEIGAGRPGFEGDILEAYRALLSAGKINPNASIKSQCPAIRNWLVENKPGQGYSAKKPGYGVIRKHLSKFFEK